MTRDGCARGYSHEGRAPSHAREQGRDTKARITRETISERHADETGADRGHSDIGARARISACSSRTVAHAAAHGHTADTAAPSARACGSGKHRRRAHPVIEVHRKQHPTAHSPPCGAWSTRVSFPTSRLRRVARSLLHPPQPLLALTPKKKKSSKEESTW